MDFRPDLSWEFFSNDEIQSRSVKAVRNHLKFLKESSEFYRESLKEIEPEDIKTPDDITKLPMTDRTLIDSNLEKFYAVSQKKIVETVVTGGATGRPLIFIITQNDLDRIAYNEALSFHSADITEDDNALILSSLDNMSISGMSLYRGLIVLGVNVMRASALRLDLYRHCFELVKPTILIGSPSLLLEIACELQEKKVDTLFSSVRKIFCTEESIYNKNLELNDTAERLKEFFNAGIYSSYMATEISTVYCECIAQNGCHSLPELVYTEIVDEKGNNVQDGAIGELVATPFGIDGVPLLRYRTGDITFKVPGNCECGRNSDRIGPILTRKSYTFKLNGKIVLPSVVIDKLDKMDYLEDYIIIVEEGNFLSDNVALHVVTRPENVEVIASCLRAEADISIPVLVSNSATIDSYRNGKSDKIIDKRKCIE